MNKTMSACVALVAAMATTAFAEPVISEPTTIELKPLVSKFAELDTPTLSYLWDGGMIPFFWMPMLGRIGLERYLSPPEAPVMFSTTEGGGNISQWEVPGWTVSAVGAGVALAIIGSNDKSRWYHAKGLGEAFMTSTLLTGILKKTVGRHRPDWSPTNDTPGERQSFPSGHTTQAFIAATYGILYLRNQVFSKYRGTQFMPWYEALTYGAITVGATAVGAERVFHNRHHITDVAAGAGIGIATSALFYWYQNRRFDEHEQLTGLRSVVIAPEVGGENKTVSLSFKF